MLFNPDYKETDHADELSWIAGGDEHESLGLKYVVHKYCGPIGSDDYSVCINKVPGRLANYHWPHFSLRPGVWRMSHLSALGPIEAGNWFERSHGDKYVAQGWKTAFLPEIHAVHLAVKGVHFKDRSHILTETYAKHGLKMYAELQQSAYDLRGTAR